MKKEFYSHGKLLLTGEYVVLDGALSLAIPTAKGQSLEVCDSEKNGVYWKSIAHDGSVWYEDHFNFDLLFSDSLTIDSGTHQVRKTLLKILRKAKELNPEFLKNIEGIAVTTQLEFPANWGLGSSSTLINNIAQWAGIDAFQLLQKSFGGSGYDIASANHDSPILYQLNSEKPSVTPVRIPWDFTDKLFFVFLNKKQNSKDGIARYRTSEKNTSELISEISDITVALIHCETLKDFDALLDAHEQLISNAVDLPTVKDSIFPDYQGGLKSLGAWGGDFILATGGESNRDYFKRKGFLTVVPFSEMIV